MRTEDTISVKTFYASSPVKPGVSTFNQLQLTDFFLLCSYVYQVQTFRNRNTRGKNLNTGVETKTCSYASMFLSTLVFTSKLVKRLS